MKKQSQTYEIIWKTVRRVPKGKVATYGQIAGESGFPGKARMVGYALHALRDGSTVPWHRVINARGEISFPPGTDGHEEQARLLRREGVVIKEGVIDLRKFGWQARG